jgi:hypothetical protein
VEKFATMLRGVSLTRLRVLTGSRDYIAISIPCTVRSVRPDVARQNIPGIEGTYRDSTRAEQSVRSPSSATFANESSVTRIRERPISL